LTRAFLRTRFPFTFLAARCGSQFRNPKSEILLGGRKFRIPNSEFFFEFFAADLLVDFENLVATELHGHQEIIVDWPLEIFAFRV